MAPSRLLLLLSWLSTSVSASCVIKIAQFGDFSGPLRTFGPNTFGVAKAAEIKINAEGIRLAPDFSLAHSALLLACTRWRDAR